jgi:hypothetical protein
MRNRAAAWLLLIAGTAFAVPAASQTAPTTTNGTGAGNAERNGNGSRNGNGKPTYQDTLIDDGKLEPDIWLGEIPERDSGGWPRGIRLDAIYSNINRGEFSQTQYGLGVGAFLATPLYGAWTFDGVFGNSEESSVATLWQRDMPFDGGWRATNGAFNVNSPSIDLSRFQPRWILPSSPMLGALTEWRNTDGTQLTAGAGEPGVFTGLYVPGFRRLGGYLSTVGGQWALNRNWSGGIQYYGARDVTSAWQLDNDDRTFSTSSWFGSTAWQDSTRRFQLNALSTDNSVDGKHTGAWADGYVQDGRYGHGFGVFYLGSNLAWGNQFVGSDTRGAYYRVNYASRQWLWDAMVDYAEPTASSTFDATTFVSGSARHQIWQDLGVGVGGNARFAGDTAWSAFAYVENTFTALVNRTQIYTARNEPKREYTVTAAQTWNVPAGTRLSTSFLVGRYDDGELSSDQYGVSLFGGGDIARELSLDANVQWLQSTGDAQPTTLIGNLGLTWRFAADFALIATLYRSQTRTDSPLLIQSPIDVIARPPDERINDRGALLILRYETRAGSMAPPLGGMVGGGAGRIAGIVYLDANEDGRFAAGEQGAANVTVILDGRYSARTDGQGRFEFPTVAAGRHTLTVMPDNVPLPWTLINEGRTEVDVPVRGSVNIDISAQRLR